MQYCEKQLKDDLVNLGIRAGDMVLMHSSYKALGELTGGAKAFFEAFIELLGEDGTLILPALSFKDVTRENPVFDCEHTPSCCGYLTEYFRTKVSGVTRSMHATHSCCVFGKHKQELIKNHELDMTPVGKNSPFSKLPKYNGKILFLGCGTGCNTSMHGVEETAEPPYCIDRENPIDYVLKNGEITIEQKGAFRHNFNNEHGHITQRYGRITELLSDDEVHFGKVLSADSCVMDSAAVWKKGREMLLKDPLWFVDYPPAR